MNTCYLIGRCGSDGELKYTQQGTAILNFSIATSEKQGETWVSTWHKIVVFAQKAEQLTPFIKKGKEVFVCGKIQNREWTDKNGNKVKSTDILANWVRPCERTAPPSDAYAGQETGYQQQPPQQQPQRQASPPPQQQPPSGYPSGSPMNSPMMQEEDVPF